jgi:hypothetical protein
VLQGFHRVERQVFGGVAALQERSQVHELCFMYPLT